MNKNEEKIAGIFATLGGIIGAIIGIIYIGIGGAILAFFVIGFITYIIIQILIEADWGCIGKLILIAIILCLIILLWQHKPWNLMKF